MAASLPLTPTDPVLEQPVEDSPAVPAPRRPSLSPSRASDFVQCPLLYRFRVIDKLPEPPSPAALRGTLVHKVLERLFDLPAPERTPQAARDLLEPQWERVREEEPAVAELFADGGEQPWLSSAADLLDRWFTLEDPTRLEPAERELLVEVDLEAGLRLRGYVDRLDVAPTGAVRVVDYKTGRSPGEGFEAKALFQMRFYALVLWRLRGVVPAMLQLVYLGDGQVLRLTPTEEDLLATERKVLALWQAIARATETGDWRPRKSRLCDWCAHQAICPLFGGTPPPLPAPAAAGVTAVNG
jgi:putative RecB family exonuclease